MPGGEAAQARRGLVKKLHRIEVAHAGRGAGCKWHRPEVAQVRSGIDQKPRGIKPDRS